MVFFYQIITLGHVVNVLLSLMLPQAFICSTKILLLLNNHCILQCPTDGFLLIESQSSYISAESKELLKANVVL